MAPRRRPNMRGQMRMDAALDAMSPYGFPNKLVRKTIQQLLKVYGGTDGWVFIEDSSYSLLIETLLENQPTASSSQDGLIEHNPGDGQIGASPAGCSNKCLLPCSNTEISGDASPTNQAIDNVSAATEPGNQLLFKAVDTVSATIVTCDQLLIKPDDTVSATIGPGNQLTFKAVDIVSATSETYDRLPIKPVDTVSAATEPGNQVTVNSVDILLATGETGHKHPIKAADNESDEPAGNFALGEIHRGTLAYSPPKTNTPQPVERLGHQRRRPCHGWISNDEEDEELIELPPATLSELKYYLC